MGFSWEICWELELVLWFNDQHVPCLIGNVLLLKNNFNLSPDVAEVSQEKLLSLVAERLIDSNSNVNNKILPFLMLSFRPFRKTLSASNLTSSTAVAMSSSASSLHFLSLTPSSLFLCNSKPFAATASLSLSSLKPHPKFVSISPSFLRYSARPFEASPSRFVVRKVAVSSGFEQDEEVLSDAEEPNFSADLKLFVGNLPFSVDSATLAELFERAGNVEMVEVIYDKITGRSRGFGFVTMSTVAEVEAAARQFNGYEIDGRELRVNSGPPPRKGESSFRGPRGGSGTSFDKSNRVYVGNLSWGVDDLALETLFSEQGKVMEAKVVYDRDSGRSRGFGFVTYSSADEVNNAIESLDGVDLNGRAIRVSMAEARPRREF